ncbi:MAG TPA: glycosyltransferase family 4 protein, partial [Anaerolineae bacterium]
MRVLLITGEFPPRQGGVGDYTFAISRGLAAQKANVLVLTSKPAEVHPPDPIDGNSFSIARTISKWNWGSLRTIVKTIQEYAPEIVDIQYQTGAYGMHPAINFLPRLFSFTPFIRVRRDVKFVTTFHDLRIPYLFPKAGPIRDWVTRVLARSSHAVITTSQQDRARLGAWGVTHLALIPIGSNIATTAPVNYERASWRSQLGVEPGELLLCHFGFVNARKGCETLIRALSQIPHAKLLMIGEQTGS